MTIGALTFQVRPSNRKYQQALWPIATLAASYALTGWLGSLIAAPPVYATLVWPPAGLALGMTLIFGRRVLLGAFLGSFFINGYLRGVIPPAEAISPNELAAPLCIAVGSTLQALAGHYLVARVWGLPIKLQRARDLALLLLVTGPAACLVSATVGVASLHFLGLLPSHLLFVNWTTWWFGDTLGVILVLPAILISPLGASILVWRGRKLESIPLAALFILILPLVITLYIWTFLSDSLFSRAMTRFSSLALESEKALIHKLESYNHALDAGAGFVENTPQLTRQGWRSFVEALNLKTSFPGIRGLGLIERVKPDGFPQFIERMRRDGAPDFNIHPVTTDHEMFVVTHIEPIQDSRPALGLDIAFERVRSEAANLSIESGKPTITGKIILIQDLKGTTGFLTMHPLYEGKKIPEAVEDRRIKFFGWVYEPVIAKDFMRDLTKSQGDLLNLTIFDGDIETDDALVYSSEAIRGASASLFVVRKSLEIMQKRWTLVWTSTPSFERLEKRHEADFVLIGGTAFSALFGAILFLLAQRKATVERLVQEQTIILRSQHAELEGTRAKLQEANDDLEERVKARTTELEAARLAAEEANEAKSLFLSNMSHELRTPMHAILAYSDMSLNAIRDGTPQRCVKFLENVRFSGKRLLRLLNDLLTLAKLESDKIEYHREPSSLKEVVDNTLVELAPLISGKNLKICASFGDNTEALFDKHYITQVVVNLLSNAIKFSSSEGQIAIEVFEDKPASGGSALCCRVADAGPGIPEGELTTIFDKFVQSSKTETGAGGTGLGLAICQKIVEGHGGRIWAENVAPKGARFTFVIPKDASPGADAPPIAADA
jgi:two-component system, sensor histidine kinase